MRATENSLTGRRIFAIAFLATLIASSCAPVNQTSAKDSAQNSDTPGNQPALEPIDTIRKSLTFTDRERMILAGVRDGTASVEEAGFYMLMGKISKFPQFSQAESTQLDAPAYGNLLRQPGRYRYQPMRISVMIYQVEKLTVDDQKISATPYWPSDKPIWALYGLADGGDKDQPLIIYSTVEPPNLSEPSKVLHDGRSEYKNGLRYDVNSVFFKLLEKIDADGKQVRQYPAVLAWQLAGLPSSKTSPMISPILGSIIMMGVVLGLAVFIFLKKKIKAAPKVWSERPISFTKTADMNENETEEDNAVDPALAEAAKQYRQEHGLDEE